MKGTWQRVPIDAQSIDAPLSTGAVFLVVTVKPEDEDLRRMSGVLDGLDGLVKAVGFRDLGAELSCIVGVGSELWDRLAPTKRPSELRPFAPLQGPVHRAPSTPGDLLFHVRSNRPDFCFEFERVLLQALGSSVVVVDEVSGFRYFDSRDLLGFVDGTANPTGADLADAALVGDEDEAFAGGSYVVVQKYLHGLREWDTLSTEAQERIIGRSKHDNLELEDGSDRKSHKSLATIVDEDGEELDILRDNMPFGRPGQGEFGTFFIGYSRRLWVIEQMLQRMFLGDPPGHYDRILDFSQATTGTTFFAPSRLALAALVKPFVSSES